MVRTETSNLLPERAAPPRSGGQAKLYNQDVDYINQCELEKLSTREETYQTDKAGKRALVESLLKSCLAPEELKLKIDSEVMFVKNDISGRYSNGTRGKIVNFTKDGKLPGGLEFLTEKPRFQAPWEKA